MPCPICLTQPGYHSFSNVGVVQDKALFYTAPAKSLDKNEDGQKLHNFSIDFREEADIKPWIWVVDCVNMTFEHNTDMSFNKGIVDLLSSSKYVQEIWILRPNMWARTTITFFQIFSKTKIFSNLFFIEGSKLEQLDQLLKRGAAAKTAKWLMQQDSTISA
jgi:hypothetical protein